MFKLGDFGMPADGSCCGWVHRAVQQMTALTSQNGGKGPSEIMGFKSQAKGESLRVGYTGMHPSGLYSSAVLC